MAAQLLERGQAVGSGKGRWPDVAVADVSDLGYDHGSEVKGRIVSGKKSSPE